MEPTSQTVPAEAIEAYNQYIHGHIDRRAFMTRVNAIAATSVAAAAMVEALTPNYAAAQQVSPSDPRIKTERVTVPSPNGNGSIAGLLARPASAGATKLPSILVVHENRGLNPHIEDVARRLAVRTSWRSRRTGSRRLAAIPAMTTKAASSSARSIGPRWRKTSTPPPYG